MKVMTETGVVCLVINTNLIFRLLCKHRNKKNYESKTDSLKMLFIATSRDLSLEDDLQGAINDVTSKF